ncbi:MAG: DUF47 family protein [Nitrososphaerota archaeon]|nr:DUF47 family protein [Nitrososphaerota archaeon]
MPHRFFDFLSRGENRILDQVVGHLEASIDAAHHLPILVSALQAHNRAAVLQECKLIGEIETRADALHQKAVEQISSGSFFGGVREDILLLLEEIDNIADAAKDSSRIFLQRDISSSAIDYMFKQDVLSFVNKLVETAEALKKAVLALREKNAKTEVVKLSVQVERREEEADEIRGSILENLLRNEIKADPLDIVMLREFLETADNVADNAEDASDVLLVLIAKGYT